MEIWRGVQEGLQAIVVNPSILLGKISDKRSSSSIYNYVQEKNKYYPLGTINYIDTRDAAKITLQLFQKETWNERFILNKESISYKKFLEKMAYRMGKTPPTKPLKRPFLKIALFGLWVKRLFSPSKNPLNRQTAAIAQQNFEFDNRKINQLLDFDYTELEETFCWALNEK
ncbi:hypothetical protein [Echinicola jeungdonensis]|uniref:hypothetical protein n=1 Tax=Echinicola jeungdonensis TaxID=709343 RepID=UPI00338F94E3